MDHVTMVNLMWKMMSAFYIWAINIASKLSLKY